MTDILTLSGAIFGLMLGPVVGHIGREKKGWILALDGYMLVSLGGLGLIFLLPPTVQRAGFWAVLFALVGLLLPSILERRIRGAQGATFWIVFAGLLLHNALDGAALSAPVQGHAHGLDYAIVLHRLPVGLLVYVSLRDRLGNGYALGMVGLLAVATVLGFVYGESISHQAPQLGLALFEAFVVGALMHVVTHREELAGCNHGNDHDHDHDHDHGHHHAHNHGHDHDHDHDHDHGHHHDHDHGHNHDHNHGHDHNHDHNHDHDHDHDHDHGHHHDHSSHGNLIEPHSHLDDKAVWGVLGAVMGLLTLTLIEDVPAVSQAAGYVFINLTLEAAPALVLAYCFAGLLNALIVQKALVWLKRGGPSKQAVKGLAFGLPLPICSCGVLPLYETLVSRGVPATAAIAFLVATPELGIDAMLISLPLLGVEMSVARLLAAVCVALLIALVLGQKVPDLRKDVADQKTEHTPLAKRLRDGLKYGFGPLVDHTIPWMIVGIAIAAYAEPLMDPKAIAGVSPFWQVPLFALMGIPMYVCASAATPLAAIAIINQVSPGAALAFLLTGPATNATTFGVLTSLHGRRIAFWFGVGVAASSICLGWLTNAALGQTVATYNPNHAHTMVEWLSLAILIILIGKSLFRQGPRGMVNHVAHPIDMH
ncbi:MAG: hypothetical protein CMH52_12635 [Myxococcales bacterium]|nr:hypothetical protein [Myxococcales bacterium]